MFSFLNKKLITVLDIHDIDIRVLQLDSSKTVVTARTLPLPDGVFKKDRIIDQKILSQKITEAMQGLSTKEVSLCIPDVHCFIHTFIIPKGLSDEAKRISIIEQAKLVIPVDHEQVYWDYADLDSIDHATEKVLYVSTPRDIVDAYKTTVESAGYTVTLFDSEALVLGRALLPHTSLVSPKPETTPVPAAPEQITMIVKISDEFATIDVFDTHHEILVSSVVPFSGGSFTRTITHSLSNNTVDTNQVINLQPETAGTTDATVLQMALQMVIDEIKKADHFLETTFQKKTSLILLAGELARMPHIEGYITQLVSIPTKIGDPLVNIAGKGAIPENIPPMIYATSIGIGLYYYGDAQKKKTINLAKSVLDGEETKKIVQPVEQVKPIVATQPSIQKESIVKKIVAIFFFLLTLGGLGFILYKYLIIPMMG